MKSLDSRWEDSMTPADHPCDRIGLNIRRYNCLILELEENEFGPFVSDEESFAFTDIDYKRIR